MTDHRPEPTIQDVIAEADRVQSVLSEIPDPEQSAFAWWLDLLLESLDRREYCIVAAEAKALADAPQLIRQLLEALTRDRSASVLPDCAECVAQQHRIDALQSSIDGCAKRVAELAGKLREAQSVLQPQEQTAQEKKSWSAEQS